MIAARLGLEHGVEHLNWLVFTEGESEIEELLNGDSLEGEIYDIRTHSQWAPATVSSKDEVGEPEVHMDLLSYEFKLPESMAEIDEDQIRGMRASSKSDVFNVNKVYLVSAGDYELPEIDSKQDYLDFNDMAYQSDKISTELPRRNAYIDLASYRAMTDDFKDEFGDRLS